MLCLLFPTVVPAPQSDHGIPLTGCVCRPRGFNRQYKSKRDRATLQSVFFSVTAQVEALKGDPSLWKSVNQRVHLL